MHAQSRKALFLLHHNISFAKQLGGTSSSFFRSARSPNSCGRLSLNLTTGPATKNQKGKPGKGSPRLEKKEKKGKWKGRMKMVAVVGSGDVRRLFVVLKAGERSLSTTSSFPQWFKMWLRISEEKK